MITVFGLSTDPTISYFCRTAAKLGVGVQLIDLSDVVAGAWQFTLPPEHPSWLLLDNIGKQRLDPYGAYYCRLVDLGSLYPTEIVSWRTVITALSSWLELCPGKVVNRPGHRVDNGCKPLHEECLTLRGFSVPPSFTGSRRSDLIAFTEEGKTIAKALSGQRADCRVVNVDDFAAYDDRSGPVHLQRFVEGDDVRAHVIGEEVIAVRITSEQSDYRNDTTAIFTPYTLPEQLAAQLCQATQSFGLAFAGWDLRIAQDRWWLLEANPMPGYNYYDYRLDGRITQTLIAYLQDSSDKGG